MARTVDSPEQARRKRISSGLFILGAFLLIAAFVLSFPVVQFEFQQGTSGDRAVERVDYEHLTSQEQRVVDGALDGTSYKLENSQPLPGIPGYAIQPETIEVTKNGTPHSFVYQTVFPTTSPEGLGVIGLSVFGLLAMIDGVRRRHFPDSSPW